MTKHRRQAYFFFLRQKVKNSPTRLRQYGTNLPKQMCDQNLAIALGTHEYSYFQFDTQLYERTYLYSMSVGKNMASQHSSLKANRPKGATHFAPPLIKIKRKKKNIRIVNMYSLCSELLQQQVITTNTGRKQAANIGKEIEMEMVMQKEYDVCLIGVKVGRVEIGVRCDDDCLRIHPHPLNHIHTHTSLSRRPPTHLHIACPVGWHWRLGFRLVVGLARVAAFAFR